MEPLWNIKFSKQNADLFSRFNIFLYKVELNGHVKCFQILEKKIKNSSNLVLVESQEEHLSDNMVIAPRLY